MSQEQILARLATHFLETLDVNPEDEEAFESAKIILEAVRDGKLVLPPPAPTWAELEAKRLVYPNGEPDADKS